MVAFLPGDRTGFSLVDVVVALVVLEVGLLGVVGLEVAALRTVARTERMDAAVEAVERVADSLVWVGSAEAGSVQTAWGRVEWAAGGGPGWIRLRALPADSLRGALVEAFVRIPGP